MEKLIELIYKYNEEKEGKRLGLITSVKENDEEIWFDKEKEVMKYECEIISKSYGFIKWLVEKDKIDTSKANDKNLNGYEIELRIRAVKELVADSEEKTVLYLNLLMLLAIQDNPINSLISILK